MNQEPYSPEKADAVRPSVCSRQQEILDELCRCADTLDAVSSGVRSAIEENKLDTLSSLREKSNAIVNEIVTAVQRLAQHRLQHLC